MGRNKDFARVELRLPPEVKEAGEVQALQQGYTSLAALLTVVATKLAADYAEPGPSRAPELPPPELLVSDHPYIQPEEVYRHQPDLYKYYIDVGVFKPIGR